VFRSFVWGGFEGATQLGVGGRRVDSVAASGHESWAILNHTILRSLGVRTAREALRWHLIERQCGIYDWSSARAQIAGALHADTEVIWDICHWGVPDHLDIMSPDWVSRLAAFAAAAARMLREEGVRIGGWVPINEMAFWAWAGGKKGGFSPFMFDQGGALKTQFLRGHLAVVDALRSVGATEPIVLCEPLIWVVARTGEPETAAEARAHVDGAFEAVEWILERDPKGIDVLGLNYYAHNQWEVEGVMLLPSDPRYRPLRDLLADVSARFPLPLAITETGAEEPFGDVWLDQIRHEIADVLARKIPLTGVCIYPIMDYPGWDNDRHCPCGAIGHDGGQRFVRAGQRAAIRRLATSV